jgi:hypothetical protein
VGVFTREKEKKKDDSDVAINVNNGVTASISSWSKSICNPEMDITLHQRETECEGRTAMNRR